MYTDKHRYVYFLQKSVKYFSSDMKDVKFLNHLSTDFADYTDILR